MQFFLYNFFNVTNKAAAPLFKTFEDMVNVFKDFKENEDKQEKIFEDFKENEKKQEKIYNDLEEFKKSIKLVLNSL